MAVDGTKSAGKAFALTLLGLTAAFTGCGKSYQDALTRPEAEKTVLIPGAGGGEEKLTPIVSKDYDGVLKGKVTFQGTPPPKREVVPSDNKECRAALASPGNQEDIYDQTWHVGEGQGVSNVVVFLRAPDGTFFPIDEEAAKLDGESFLDQPFCAFHPQVALHFSKFKTKDAKIIETGQKLTIYNKGSLLHNANLQDADIKYKNSGFNLNIVPGSKIDVKLNPQPGPLKLTCSIHAWMKANIWVFGHPYAVKTNDKGEFTIRNVPAGVDLQVVFWHPGVGFFGKGGMDGEVIRLDKGQTKSMDTTISPK